MVLVLVLVLVVRIYYICYILISLVLVHSYTITHLYITKLLFILVIVVVYLFIYITIVIFILLIFYSSFILFGINHFTSSVVLKSNQLGLRIASKCVVLPKRKLPLMKGVAQSLLARSAVQCFQKWVVTTNI